MSTQTLAAPVVVARKDPERGHRVRLIAAYVLGVSVLVALAVYGFDYYRLDAAQRPQSLKYALLKPSGSIGLALGYLGLAMFFSIFLYPIRRHWQWLGQQGSSKHWMDFHVLLGVLAPFVIAFHSSFKFNGFAGMAFWIMVAVALSGVIGRYVYGQIPRSLNAAEISIGEMEQKQKQLAESLAAQQLLPTADLNAVLRLPNAETVNRMPAAIAIVYMIALDVLRWLHIAALRRHALQGDEKLRTLGGVLRTGRWELERAIDAARDQASLSKRILFLSRTRKIFQLWHVIHKPFSYSFAVLAVIHIAVVMLLGFTRI